jgi:hypothetical protein
MLGVAMVDASKGSPVNSTADFQCGCGRVSGRVIDASPSTVNRIVCYCDDCQAFLHHLGRADLLDARGGSDIVQLAPATLRFERGSEQILGLRLSPKGMYRWYTSCCKTPVGNTVTPAIPFVGVLVAGFHKNTASNAFGEPVAELMGRFATPPLPESKLTELRLLVRMIAKLLGWKLRGRTWPHPFFDQKTRAPKYAMTTLTQAERDALRPLCGPDAAPRTA